VNIVPEAEKPHSVAANEAESFIYQFIGGSYDIDTPVIPTI
jgi:hypothetical protein